MRYRRADVAALYFDKLIILDLAGASWDTVGADHIAGDAVRQLKDAGILEHMTPGTVLVRHEPRSGNLSKRLAQFVAP